MCLHDVSPMVIGHWTTSRLPQVNDEMVLEWPEEIRETVAELRLGVIAKWVRHHGDANEVAANRGEVAREAGPIQAREQGIAAHRIQQPGDLRVLSRDRAHDEPAAAFRKATTHAEVSEGGRVRLVGVAAHTTGP